ncbi:Long-chain-fatty-acid--CoA ligase [Euzebya pacifica]|uniref:Long-chain-fatty-acid--CoA ligase n=1 Tax=Euzebya pacifica TaxID=1608957 RepID=A0A346Y366_9ACTN|nr:AMP-binding protein [Euzebya pacifica]AXV08913.1 Long-chain-fatty-acid--CoA ligase [Euzebya pacifica]
MDYLGQHIGRIVRERASTSPDVPVVTISPDGAEPGTPGVPITYAELDDRTEVMAAALTRAGVTKGDRAAVMLANGPSFVHSWIGMAKAGVVEVPLHTASRGDGLRHALGLTGASLAVVDERALQRIGDVAHDLPSLRTLVVCGDPDDLPGRVGGADVVSMSDFVHGVRPGPAVDVADTDPSVVLFTSGTTGPSKGVVLSHRANTRLAWSVGQGAGFQRSEVLFTTFPLFHVAARYVSTLAAMLVEGRVVIRERFSASRFWEECAEEGVTAVHYLGSLLTMLLKQPARSVDSGHGVRVGYGAGAPKPVAEAFTERFGVPLHELYGMTETGAVTMNRAGAYRLGSCGTALEDCEVAVVGADDEALPAGEVGEIVTRPSVPHIMIEQYEGMPEATVDAFRNLWFHTGDRGWLDADGFLHFVGRQKDAIRRRGENVSAFEVEVVLEDHPSVAGSAVVGVPDEISGEEILAYLELREGAVLDVASVLDHCQTRLPHFAVPRYVAAVASLPRNTSQRVQKHLLDVSATADGVVDREAIGYVVTR